MQDPFAAQLAGERGMAILRALPQPEMMRFGIGIRSRPIDQLLLETLEAPEALLFRPDDTTSEGCTRAPRPHLW